jgi:hypothetical protein
VTSLNAAAILKFNPLSLIAINFLSSAPLFSTRLCSDIFSYHNMACSFLSEKFSWHDSDCCVFVILLILFLRRDHISYPYLLAIHDYLPTALFRGCMPLMFRGRRLACRALIQPYYISYVYCSLILVTEKLYTALLAVTHYSMIYCFFPSTLQRKEITPLTVKWQYIRKSLTLLS